MHSITSSLLKQRVLLSFFQRVKRLVSHQITCFQRSERILLAQSEEFGVNMNALNVVLLQ
jgi:hypothetical protein